MLKIRLQNHLDSAKSYSYHKFNLCRARIQNHCNQRVSFGSAKDVFTCSTEFIKKEFGYAMRKNSIPLAKYNGPMKTEKGLSTYVGAANLNYGGGWIKAKLNVPLSTSGVEDCSMINLVNKRKGEHLIFHVHPKSSVEDIISFITEQFNSFDKVNIIPGNLKNTIFTTDKILAALRKINPAVKKCFYHFSTKSPEIVAYKGKLGYIENLTEHKASFKEVLQFYYSSAEHS